MGTDALLTVGVLAVVGIMLIRDRHPALLVLGGAVASLLFLGVIDTDVALGGLSSPAPATIAALYVVAGAATLTGVFASIVDRVLGRTGSVWRLAGATALLSSVVPNTPLVAMFAPRVVRWSQRSGSSSSQLLMPLSFASLLGGVVTVLGTSTNLVVSDLMRAAGEEPLGVFEVTVVGLPVAVAGIVVLCTVGVRLLPERSSAASGAGRREFQMAASVDPAGPLVGRSVAESGLRGLGDVFLAMIERQRHDGRHTFPATPGTVLEAGDVCCFVGAVDRVVEIHEFEGLTSLERPHLLGAEGPGTTMFEAVISPASPLIGATLRSVDFRNRYGGAVLAVHRADGRVGGQLGRVELRAGDVLLVLADDDFADRWRGAIDFSLVGELDERPPARRARAWVVPTAVVAMIVVAATGALSLFEAALAAAVCVVAAGTMTAREAFRSINVDVVLTMAVAISLGGAVAASGLAGDIAGLVDAADAAGLGRTGLVVTLMVVTIGLTELLTNTAAAALMVPVALSAAAESGADPRAAAVAVLIGASCSFLSPIGYQTNLMVYGLGGYRFLDFARVGCPITVTVVGVAGAIVGLV